MHQDARQPTHALGQVTRLFPRKRQPDAVSKLVARGCGVFRDLEKIAWREAQRLFLLSPAHNFRRTQGRWQGNPDEVPTRHRTRGSGNSYTLWDEVVVDRFQQGIVSFGVCRPQNFVDMVLQCTSRDDLVDDRGAELGGSSTRSGRATVIA